MATAEETKSDLKMNNQVAKVWRFLLHFLEMLLAMGAGMGIFHLLVRLIPASSSLNTAIKPGTNVHAILMMAFMTIPMLGWMIIRGHGWRHSLEMGIGMVIPMLVIALLCQLGLSEYLPWLTDANSAAMFLGMIAVMIYRRDHYTGSASHSAHTVYMGSEPESHAS